MLRRSLLLGLLLAPLIACGDKDDDDDDDDTGDDSGDDGGDGGGDDGGDGGGDDGGGDGSIVEMVTSMGTIVIDLNAETAPISTANFLAYVDAGFYDGTDGDGATIFHRVLEGFVAQAGGYTETGTQKSTMPAITLESDVGLSNVRGTIAMARTSDFDSATTQFYFNLVDNTFLDYASASEPGYAVFGEVIEGMEVVDAIAGVAVNGDGVPDEVITIDSVTAR